ncbi:MAG: hypothetical protein GKC05_04350 [Methanomicrobiales archaeon]|nr:hypothetical protein [Methanomicrobiales archaeon]NYT20516.1 hypothetical protein [Methanomicrobiales archaeon]
MSSVLPTPESRATGVGALPHIDPAQACDEVLSLFPEIPFIPTLPNRGILETIVFNDSSRLPGGVVQDGKLRIDSSRDLAAGMEQIYLDFMEQNTAPYALSPEYYSGFFEMRGRDLAGSLFLKAQVTGPVTFGMQVVDENRRPIYYDDQFADVLGKMIALRARWCDEAMRRFAGVTSTLVVLNEPYFASLGSSVIPVHHDTVIAGWQDIAGMIEGGLGIHCCSNTDWEFVMGLHPSFISFDAYTVGREFLLYPDALAGYLERGGIVAWGIVPSQPELFGECTEDQLYSVFAGIRDQVTGFCSPETFYRQSVITPTCGIQSGNPETAIRIMQAARTLSLRIREEYSG